jgi:hypothetical protein
MYLLFDVVRVESPGELLQVSANNNKLTKIQNKKTYQRSDNGVAKAGKLLCNALIFNFLLQWSRQMRPES